MESPLLTGGRRGLAGGTARILWAVLVLWAAAPSAARAGNEWFEVAPLPVARAFHMAAYGVTAFGPRLYSIGGQRSPTDSMERLCTEYSPQSNSWTQRAAMTQRRGLGQACILNGKVWVFGGCRTFGTGLTSVEVFDPVANTWSNAVGMPTGLYDFGAVVWRDSLMFIVGGGSWHPSMPPTATVRLLDPNTQTWYVATSLPVPLGATACAVVGDTLLVATGWTNSGPTNRAWRGVITPSNPRIINWQELDTLPGPRRCRAVSGVANGELYVVGGLKSDAGSSLGRPASLDPRPAGFSGLSDVWSLAGRNEWTRRADKPRAVSSVSGNGSDAAAHIYVAAGYPGAAPYLETTEYLDMSSFTHDAGVAGVISPAGRLTPNSACPVSVLVRNFGAVEEDLALHVAVVESVTHSTLFSADTALSLDAGSSLPVELGTFVPPWLKVFRTTASVTLGGDENPANDTGRARSRTTLGSDPDGYGYVYKTTQEADNLSFSWFDTTGSTLINDWAPNGDEGLSRRHLPFQFNFYSSGLGLIYLCSNGYIQTSNSIAGLNFPLPCEDITDIIAPLWDDLSVRDSGHVLEKLTSDRAVYTWVDARRAPPDTGRLTFQVVLQIDGDIRFNYLNVTADASSSTIGIQGADGSSNYYQEYVYNADPTRHVPSSYTSILFDKPPLGVNEGQAAASLLREISFSTLCRGPVRITVAAGVRSLQVFNVSGSLVRTLAVPSSLLPSPSALTWDRRDEQGRRLPAGAYLLRAVSPAAGLTRKLVLLD